MKRPLYLASIDYCDIYRQECVEPTLERLQASPCGRTSVGYLPACVYAGIRPPREIPPNGFLGELLPRGLQLTLNRLRPLLEL